MTSLGAIHDADDGKLQTIRELSDAEAEQVAAAVAGLLRFQSQERLYRIAQRNLEELDAFAMDALTAFAEETQTSLLRGIPPGQVSNLSVEANRHVLNVLSSFRMYLDHVETDVKRSFGGDSPEARLFAEACSKQYDSNPSYGFVYKLRNYTQHCGLPVANVVLSGSVKPLWADADTPTAAFTSEQGHRSLVLSFDRSDLLQEFHWTPAVRAFISAQDDQFEVRGHLGAAFRSLEVIHGRLVSHVMPSALRHATTLATFHEEVRRQSPGAIPVTVTPREDNPRKVRIAGLMDEEVASVLSAAKRV